ncbi:hypothetical protein NA57DRAFT_70638 [Rhizodiscina lignyota]|uniref:Exoribonuclease phosphorolytic domain-containing protein n=1 Tax=Rhizodiscina lignyota TaxID=1504668 RepID=A0A9P4IQX2_9PEZI|nr:hypothetical protein NA57DRAFT_70638 [Rhizodiscina lignyota]
MAVPEATLSHLNRADGSATYSSNGYTVVGAVNGPIEVQRRDELPEEAAIEVNIRPAVGVGSTKERYLESILQSTLRRIILTHTFPRTLIQLTLQVVNTPAPFDCPFTSSPLPLLPALLETAMLALLSASLPLASTYTSVGLALAMPSPVKKKASLSATAIMPIDDKALEQASSIHVFAFTADGDLLVAESEGLFAPEYWEHAYDRALELCIGSKDGRAEGEMVVEGEPEDRNESQWLRSVMQEKAEQEQRWKT